MATKYYGIKDNWTDDDVANVIEVASEDGSVSSVKVNGVEYGGGGGGGFPTITIEVEGVPDADFELYFGSGFISGDNVYALYNNEGVYQTQGPSLYPGMSGEFLVLTDNLSITAYSEGSASVTISGDVTYNPGEEPYYTITGSCKFIVS